MFCGYCGNEIKKNDMKFCPNCGKTLDFGEEVAADVQVTAQPEVASPVQSDMHNSIEWELYNTINVDTSDLPDIKDNCLVYGESSLLLSDIVDYTFEETVFSIKDKNGNAINVDCSSKAKDVAKAVACIAVTVLSPVIVTGGGAGSVNKGKLERVCTQMLRIAPLLGDETLRRRGKAAAELTLCGKDKDNLSFIKFMNFVKEFEVGEYPIYAGSLFWVTNKKVHYDYKLVTHKCVDINEIKEIDIDVLFLKGYGEGKKKVFSAAIEAQDIPGIKKGVEIVNKILSYNNFGKIDEFIASEYIANTGIVKAIYRV